MHREFSPGARCCRPRARIFATLRLAHPYHQDCVASMVQSRTSISALGPRRNGLPPGCAGPPVAQGELTASRRKACDLTHAERAAGNPDHAVARVARLVLRPAADLDSNMAALPIVSSFSVRRPAHHRVYSTPGGCRRRIGRARVTPRAGVRALQRGNSLSEYRTANRRILFPVSTRASAVNAMIGIDRTA
jgi:hypothetical protein